MTVRSKTVATPVQHEPQVQTRARKKSRPRVRLTHIVIHRGGNLRLRVAIADDAMAECGDELGTLVKKIAPSTQVSSIPAVQTEADAIFATHETHDLDFHQNARAHLV